MKTSILFFCIILTLSCSNKQHNNNNVQEYQVDFQTSEEIILSDIITNYNLVVLETTESSVLGEILKTILHNNRIFILSNNAVLTYNTDGKLIQKLSKTGRGPGEYIGITDFDIYDEVIYVLDRDNQSILQYDLAGNHLKSQNINMWAQKLIVLNENEILLYSGEEDNSYNQCKYSILSKDNPIKGQSYQRNCSYR